MLQQTARNFAVVIGIVQVDDELLHPEHDEDHGQRSDKRDASDDQRVSNNLSAVFGDVSTHVVAF